MINQSRNACYLSGLPYSSPTRGNNPRTSPPKARPAPLREGRRHRRADLERPGVNVKALGRNATSHNHHAHDNARADYREGDEVTFTSPDGPRRGEIVKLNPKSAKVRCEETGWNVSYGLLHRAGRESARNGAERLNGVAGMARRLMDEHGLTG